MRILVVFALTSSLHRFVRADDSSSSSSTGLFDLSSSGNALANDSSSSTGATNSTGDFLPPTLASSDSEFISGLPVSNVVAIVILCCLVVFVCICLFCCARQQMKETLSSPAMSNPKDSRIHARLQAKLEAARRGWKRERLSELSQGPHAVVTPRSGAPTPSNHRLASFSSSIIGSGEDIFSSQYPILTGGSLGGLGSLRYSDFRPQDFEGEPWATPQIQTSLRKSGNILDVVITSKQSMYLSLLSGLVPLSILCGLPFHKYILKVLKLTDWYGPIEEVDLEMCMIIAASGTIVHVISFLLSMEIFNFDQLKAKQRLAAKQQAERARQKRRMEMQQKQSANKAEMAILPTLTVPSHPQMPFILSPTSSTMPRPHMGMPNFSPTASIANSAPDPQPEPTSNLWPLRIFCVLILGGYGLLGFQAYISCDESACRHYGITSTPKAFWPPTAGKGPAITFILCLIVGVTAIIPTAFAIKLVALFHPRRVHPNLLPKSL